MIFELLCFAGHLIPFPSANNPYAVRVSSRCPELWMQTFPNKVLRLTQIRKLANRNLCTTRNIYGVDTETLIGLLADWKVPSYRANQVREWVYGRGAESFDSMNNLPAALREKLSSEFRFGDLSTQLELLSKADGTVKRVYALPDNQLIESVLMPYETGRTTACISSQAGCGMNCSFCATGQMGFSRQLSAAEIFEQVLRFRNMLLAGDDKRALTNVVFMGMGEPLANYNSVLLAVRRIMSELGIGARHITISTVGIPPRIRKLAHESITGWEGDTSSLQVNLAVSLHCATNTKRSSIMPVNNRYPIDELLAACKYYTDVTNRRISFEWALIDGDTDTEEAAVELGSLLSSYDLRHLCHVNVIPLNPTDKFAGKPSSKKTVQAFIDTLKREFGITATPRVRRGIDIDAGCGQLKAEVMRKLRSERQAARQQSLSNIV
jgi:23S rRNA (adenine2503-C2)-methyltransferase